MTLGMSYVQFAMQGLRHQMSQGAANWTIDPGDRFTFYRLVDSVVPSTVGKDGHEKSFFDGIDTSLAGIGGETRHQRREKLPRIAAGADRNREATLLRQRRLQREMTRRAAAAPLMQVVAGSTRSARESLRVRWSAATNGRFAESNRGEKQQQAETALNLALGVTLAADVSSRR